MTHLIDSVTRIPPPFNMIVLVVLIVTATSVFREAIKQIRKFASHRLELEFKRELLDRGLSGEEVEQVVRSRGPNSATDS